MSVFIYMQLINNIYVIGQFSLLFHYLGVEIMGKTDSSLVSAHNHIMNMIIPIYSDFWFFCSHNYSIFSAIAAQASASARAWWWFFKS